MDEVLCQLCGVSFSACRIRRPDEPPSAAWGPGGFLYVFADGKNTERQLCGPESGCRVNFRGRLFHPDYNRGAVDYYEHIAGHGCISTKGFSGHRITVDEMRGCNDVLCLLYKEDNWQPESEDQDYELSSQYFLSGTGNGSVFDDNSLHVENITPVRHGIKQLVAVNTGRLEPLPLHPACFEVFKRVSLERLGYVSLHSIWQWRSLGVSMLDSPNSDWPRCRDVIRANQTNDWAMIHEPGSEYIVANPNTISGLQNLLKTCYRNSAQYKSKEPWNYGRSHVFNVNSGVFWWRHKASAFGSSGTWHNFPSARLNYPRHATSSFGVETSEPEDPLMSLPTELLFAVLDYLSSKDIANLRRSSRSCRQLPIILFRRLLLEEFPWMYELKDIEPSLCDWYKLYKFLKFSWVDLKGLWNRERIWKDVNAIMDIVQKATEDGFVAEDGDVTEDGDPDEDGDVTDDEDWDDEEMESTYH